MSGCLTPAGAVKAGSEDGVSGVEPVESFLDLPGVQEDGGKSEEGKIYHVVLEGETLWRIAKAYGIDEEEIKKANGLKSGNVRVGQELHMPGATERVEVQKYRPPKTGQKFIPGEDFGHPCVGIVSKGFGQWKGGQKTDGIDYSVSPGARAVASRTGEVVLVAKSFPGYGTVVILKHGPQYRTFYGYLSETQLQEGDAVEKGEVVGVAGREPRTGKTKMHFKLYDGAKPVDPMRKLR